MYTIKETAEVLRKSPKTVRRYVQSGLLPARRSGLKSIVIPESKLIQFMEPETNKEVKRITKTTMDRVSEMYKKIT